MWREKAFTYNESEVLNVIMKAHLSVIDFDGSINKCSNKANLVRWSSETKIIS